MNFKFFSTFVGHFCPPNPDPDSESGSTDPIESGSNPDQDPQPCSKVFTKLYRLKNHQLIHLGTALWVDYRISITRDVASLVSKSDCQCMKLCCSPLGSISDTKESKGGCELYLELHS
jgi:hypothetical protein